jgi:alpha/beta hydrolase fold
MSNSICVLATCTILLAFQAGCMQAAEKPKVQSLDAQGVKISYSIQGQGEPVILIHGWLSSGWINWQLPGTAGLLAKDFQVITIDVRGHGNSDKPTKDEAYGLELVEDVVRVMDHLKIKKAHLVGYSMGGIITAKFLAKHPDRARSGTLGGMGWLRAGSAEQKFFGSAAKDEKPLGICFRSLAKLALTEEEIKSIKAPVVILFGSGDILKKPYVEPLKPVRPDWQLIDIADADHLSCIMKPQFREEIQKWLGQQTKK